MKIVGILGSPSPSSRSASLMFLARARLQPVASSIDLIAVRDLPAEALLHAQFDHPAIRHALAKVAAAQVVIVATPIYKVAYSGVLKAFLDLLPENALRGKTVIPLATAGSIAHLLALEYALKPVLSALGARDILDAVFADDAQIPCDPILGYTPEEAICRRMDSALRSFVERLARAPQEARRTVAATSLS